MPYKDPVKRAEAARKATAKYRAENLEEVRARDAELKRLARLENPEKVREEDRKRDQSEKRKQQKLANSRKRRGIPEPTRPAPELCELCQRPQSKRYKTLSIDHCHETGRFLGWLCSDCNLGKGKLGDTKQSALNLVAYYERAEC